MNRFLKTILFSGALAAASVSGYVLADAPNAQQGEGWKGRGHHRGGHLRGGAGMLTRHAQELGLTAQQLTAIKAAEEAARPELEKLHQAAQVQREALVAGKGSGDQMKAAHDAISSRLQALRNHIDGIMTAEQRTKLAQMRAQRHHDGRGRKGPHAPEAPQAPTRN